MSNLYSNQLERELKLPIPLGPFARVLVDYHKNWGLDTSSVSYEQELKEAEESYVSEYLQSTGNRSRTIGSIGRNYNLELNQQNGAIVAALAYDIEGPINLVDLGGGDGTTTELAYRAMQRLWLARGRPLDDLNRRLHVTFVEPSVGMMQDAIKRLDSLGLSYTSPNIPAHQIVDFVEPESQDICMETAALHHYPNPQKPYKAANKILRPGGAFVVNEWCHSLFEHPLRFRQVLERLEWPTKREDIKRYDQFFGFDEEYVYLDGDPMEAAANKQMLDWYTARFGRTVDYVFYTLEAHCPPRLILNHLRESGFMVEDSMINKLISNGIVSSNPHTFSPPSFHSSIIAVK